MGLKDVGQCLESGHAAQLRIDLSMVHHIVAMGAARASPQHGRKIDMGNAQRRKVWNLGGGVGEGESGMHLQTIGGCRTIKCIHRSDSAPVRHQITLQGGSLSLAGSTAALR